MPKISKSQKIGFNAQDYILSTIMEHPSWIARGQEKDFGIDLEAEYCESSGEVTGSLIKIQVKGTESINRTDDFVFEDIEIEYLKYVYQFRIPVILVLVDTTTKLVWYSWLQNWILENEVSFLGKQNQETIRVKIPIFHTLEAGLSGDLELIAKGVHPSALTLSLREIALAARNLGDAEIFDAVLALINEFDSVGEKEISNKTIDALIGLGPNPAFWKSQQHLPQILSIVRRAGGSLTANNISKLVVRDESYSRTGLIGLSVFYDDWFDAALKLELPTKFEAMGLIHLAWYCAFRESNSEMNSMELWGKISNRKVENLIFYDLELLQTDDAIDYIFRKWPIREDSVYLDCLKSTSPLE